MNYNTTIVSEPRFKGEILKKIYRIWLFRKLLPILLIEVAILSLVFYQLGQAVFIQRILNNAYTILQANPPKIFLFLTSAFANAPFATKLLGLGAIIFLALLIRHLTQGFLRLVLVKENYFGKVNN